MAGTVSECESRQQQRPASFAGPLPSLSESVGDQRFLAIREKRHSVPIAPVPKFYVPNYTQYFLDGKPLCEYQICGKPYTMQQPPNEGVATFQRTTVNGRNLSYRLKVVQQPEKARACGSGPRSSADRRPVDPPPVVKLTIYDQGKDITVNYEAGFMLYASLDVARPIANGRMHTGTTVPVLTGVAVAGVAYLERPKPAGYFIFPDLSVRHEGWYRLRFHLFEQVKERGEADPDRPFLEVKDTNASDRSLEPAVHEAMANRMFVYSAPFQVFSAKKFPGLNTSTELSKVVADQGCRVRIRREIRQRRKPKGKGEDEEDRKSGHGTPEPTMHHRALSRDGSEASRRISMEVGQHQLASRRSSIEHATVATPLIGPSSARQQPLNIATTNIYQAEARNEYASEADKLYSSIPQTPASGLPRTMTPNAEHSGLILPPISSLYNASSASPRPRGYNLPESTSHKRSYSPRTYSQDLSLKDGARPDTIAQPQQTPKISRQRSPSTLSWLMNSDKQPEVHVGGSIEADDPWADNSDSDDSLLDGPFVYRRADGTKSGKPLITPTYR